MGNQEAKVVQNFRYPSGNVYSGEMIGGKRAGQGTLTWPDGGTYTGGWQNDLCEGQGTMKFPNGSVYEGNFARNNPYGQGKLTTINGEVVYGFWSYEGRAEHSTAIGKYTFQGEIIDLKTNQRTLYHGPLAFYLVSGLVSLPHMPDPAASMLPFAIAMVDEKGEPKGSDEKGDVPVAVPVAVPVVQAAQMNATSSSSIAYGQQEPALQPRHPDDHAAYSLLDPRLYLAGLGVPTQPANLNERKQNEIRQARNAPPVSAQAGTNPPTFH